ncbi:MAG: hypothetical protein M1825_005725 [Sarcosagium campestre]|nr:MAG: hypothetical protein M1825_005725 [Sarcosagium campestre]
MVFKPLTHLARQSFGKFTHGYAQSLVAASQSSYAPSPTSFGPFGTYSQSRFGKSGTLQIHNAFHNSPAPSSQGGKAGHTAPASQQDGGLAAYYAAWQQQHDGDQEWKQFPFVKTIGWSASPAVAEAQVSTKVEDGETTNVEESKTSTSRESIKRANSDSAIEDLKDTQNRVPEDSKTFEADVAPEVGPSSATEATSDSRVGEEQMRETTSTSIKSIEEDLQQPGDGSFDTSYGSQQSSPAETLSSLIEHSSISNETTASSVSDDQSPAYTNHLENLVEARQWAEVAAVFEALLAAGTKPSPKAYNALLAAAIHLPAGRHQVVPKALDVYADMLRRRVSPNAVTYSTLIELLATRTIDVASMKQALDVKQLRFGGMNGHGSFMFGSHEAETDILLEDDSLSNAIRLFDASAVASDKSALSTEAYRLLITACAERQYVNDMIRIYAHMERQNVIPDGRVFSPMIGAFAAARDLVSAVECYNEYKVLAVANDAGENVLQNRVDELVYAAVVKAYRTSGKEAGASKFLTRIEESYKEAYSSPEERVRALKNLIVSEAFINADIDRQRFGDAISQIQKSDLDESARNRFLAKACTAAADRGHVDSAKEAFRLISSPSEHKTTLIAMLALHIRRGDVTSASPLWRTICADEMSSSRALIEPTAMYAVALAASGRADEGLAIARHTFSRIRLASPEDVTKEIDEGVDFIGRYLVDQGFILPLASKVDLLWMIQENGAETSPTSNFIINSIGPEDVVELSVHDLTLILQVQAGMICSRAGAPDMSSSARFSHLLESVVARGAALDPQTAKLIENCLTRINAGGAQNLRPDLVQMWEGRLDPNSALQRAGHPDMLEHESSMPSQIYAETFDPHSSSTDFKGSSAIIDELERSNGGFGGSGLNDALARFKNIRRAGRHPRYIVYAKLIAAAARDGRTNVVHDVLAMARTDVPLLPQYRVVRHGWVSILDAMVGASLTMGKRDAAAQYHRELLEIGAAPSANTFGLYITTLKESTKTFDEATEAVQIFHRAKDEGVEPSSFLYNALIGKLGKARRIDDCLYYFAEMRGLGIRPTSVTYGTIVNALCRVSDDRFAEELFEEMESMPNYKARPAPYNSLMQYFLTTKREKGKVLSYFNRMKSRNIQPTMHTYKLLVDTHATLEPVDMNAAEEVLESMRRSGLQPEAVHYASLIHAHGCVLHDLDAARSVFDRVLSERAVRPQACLFQALFEAMVANHSVADTEVVLQKMRRWNVEMTAYIANTLIHGWTLEKNIDKARGVYEAVGASKREPSTYEAMTRAFLAVEDKSSAVEVAQEMSSRGYPSAVAGKITELVYGGSGTGRNSLSF